MATITLSGAAAAAGDAASHPNLVPRPESVTISGGVLSVSPSTRFVFASIPPGFENEARVLARALRAATGRKPGVTTAGLAGMPMTAVAIVQAADPELGDEGYRLEVTTSSIRIEAAKTAGAFYGVTTLAQMLPDRPADGAQVPCLRIADKPRYGWRGMMLDCSRHFMDVEFVKRFLDRMADLKLNRFHWHLIDSNGWRMEVKSKPRLTEVAAWRGPAGKRHGGFYTHDEIREIVAYARARHIVVVPEFEMPGHSDAALVAYPELSCAGKPYKLPTRGKPDGAIKLDDLGWYTTLEKSRPFCAGNDDVFAFHDAVFAEAATLFDSPWWHIGGDERPSGHWANCPKCRARMKAGNLADEHALQNWFMKRCTDLLARRGKRAISWAVTRTDSHNPKDLDDVGNNAISQSWHNERAFAARKGWDVVVSNDGFLYFDYPETTGTGRPKWMPLLTLEKVYSFDPTPDGLSTTETRHILGPEACLWTELVPQDQVMPQIFPRILALAEIAWSPREGKDFPDFRRRVGALEPRLARLGVSYGKAPEKPIPPVW